jgi:competence ComEA-like helix-hairpin-helix protein
MKGRFWIAVSVCLALGLGIPAQDDDVLPEGKGKETVENTCTECHGLDKIFSEGRTRGQWETVVNKMRIGGATMTDAEYADVLEYLVTHFGAEEEAKPKAEAKINVNKAGPMELETGLKLSSDEAMAIVRHREARGAFKEWVDLTKVDGVDKAKIEAAKDRLSF